VTRLWLCAAGGGFAAVSLVAFAAEPMWHVTPTKIEDFPGGFRRYFRNPADSPDTTRFLFQSSDETSPVREALIGIDGTKFLLRGVVLRVQRKVKVSEGIGDTLYQRFVGKGIDVEIDATVTYVCQGSENCEETAYRATLKVTKDGGSRTIDVVGDCGV
jgi:hypothetical protein